MLSLLVFTIMLLLSSFLSTNAFRMTRLSSARSMAVDASSRAEMFRTIKASAAFTHEHLPSETLFIFDGTAMVHQAFHGNESKGTFKDAVFEEAYRDNLLASLPHLLSPAGINDDATNLLNRLDPLGCGALAATVMTFARFIRDIKPSYLAVAFDSKGSFRQKLLPSYKAHRPRTVPGLVTQLVAAPTVMAALGAKVCQADGYEADDVMASLGTWGRSKGLNVVHVSIDKDMLQLITEGVHVMHPFTQVLSSNEEVLLKHGVQPSSFADYQCLMGDAVDNIPGAPGIGSKTAAKLMSHFGSLERMLSMLHIGHGRALALPDAVVEELVTEVVETAEEEVTVFGEEAVVQEEGVKKKRSKKPKVTLPELSAAIGPERALEAVTLLESVVGSRVKALSVIASLLAAGEDRLRLYKQLVLLKTDLQLNEITSDAVENSDYFRFKGEDRLQMNDMLVSISSSFRMPLGLLRQQYHKLDRE